MLYYIVYLNFKSISNHKSTLLKHQIAILFGNFQFFWVPETILKYSCTHSANATHPPTPTQTLSLFSEKALKLHISFICRSHQICLSHYRRSPFFPSPSSITSLVSVFKSDAKHSQTSIHTSTLTTTYPNTPMLTCWKHHVTSQKKKKKLLSAF